MLERQATLTIGALLGGLVAGGVPVSADRSVYHSRHGVLVAGEQTAADAPDGVVYEDARAWRTATGLGTRVAVGTLLRRLPAAAKVRLADTTYYRDEGGVFYTRVSNGGEIVYQAVRAPEGAVVVRLPPGCLRRVVDGVSYRSCGATYYRPVPGGYRVATPRRKVRGRRAGPSALSLPAGAESRGRRPAG
jgi:uncharacterized protein DUF6515